MSGGGLLELYLLNIACLKKADMFFKYYAECPRFYREKIDKLNNIDDKCRSLACGLLFLKGLQERCISADNAEILLSKHGKPYLKCGSTFFNFSHSGEYVAAVFSDAEVGVDIEMHREVNLKIAERYFKTSEYEHLCSISDCEVRQKEFFRLWVRKESLLKAVGVGLCVPLNSFEVLDDNYGVIEICFEGGKYRIFEYDVPGYSLAVCHSRKRHTAMPEIQNICL